MITYEYKTCSSNSWLNGHDLNQLGVYGWELVDVIKLDKNSGFIYYFTRQLKDE